ncbi:MAG: hypothetical protein CFE42_23600 [Ralstonia sp. PBBBR1]|uniref:Uncharacterized protein n=1 Tax=Ralstonia pickettii (strain 12D) TaxID=428406 RepID=C6BRB7_RALP1|nr:MAG: hypothetical protein CFE42_23600 [Ralstonia sp. PBBBR1]
MAKRRSMPGHFTTGVLEMSQEKRGRFSPSPFARLKSLSRLLPDDFSPLFPAGFHSDSAVQPIAPHQLQLVASSMQAAQPLYPGRQSEPPVQHQRRVGIRDHPKTPLAIVRFRIAPKRSHTRAFSGVQRHRPSCVWMTRKRVQNSPDRTSSSADLYCALHDPGAICLAALRAKIRPFRQARQVQLDFRDKVCRQHDGLQ